MVGSNSSAIVAFLLLLGLTACGTNYSPNIYSSNVVQQANKVDQGIVVGIRAVAISANTTIGVGTGGAAGGIAGSQAGSGALSALSALGGTVAGGMVGAAVQHSQGDTSGFEYIVRKGNGDLLSVTQKDDVALPLWQHVLVIEGAQARIVVDYTVEAIDDSPRPAAAALPVHAVQGPGGEPPADRGPQRIAPRAPAPVVGPTPVPSASQPVAQATGPAMELPQVQVAP